MAHSREEAAKYVQGWDTYDAIEATARLGLAEEDRRILRETYGDDADRVAEEIVAICRARVAAEE